MNLVHPYDPILWTKVPHIERTVADDHRYSPFVDADHLPPYVEAISKLANQLGVLCLAANQVGLPLRMFVLHDPTDYSVEGNWSHFINPVIEPDKGCVPKTELEKCVNFTNTHVWIERYWACTVHALSLSGRPFQRKLFGPKARDAMQAVDLLNGITILEPTNLGRTVYNLIHYNKLTVGVPS